MSPFAVVVATFAEDIQQAIFNAAEILLYPVLIAAIVCLIWVLIELGWLCYEVYLRVRYRDLEALEIRTLKARDAFARGKPRLAYRYLQENNYSMVVVKFLFDLIRNYQTERLAEKPLKLLQEYEFYTIKRLEKTRILVRIGPMLGLMGTLIPLAPALAALAEGDTETLAENLRIAFSVTVIGLLIGGLAFMISMFRDRIYSQDISDLEYLLELLEGGGGKLRHGSVRKAARAGERASETGEEAEEELAAAERREREAEVLAAETGAAAIVAAEEDGDQALIGATGAAAADRPPESPAEVTLPTILGTRPVGDSPWPDETRTVGGDTATDRAATADARQGNETDSGGRP